MCDSVPPTERVCDAPQGMQSAVGLEEGEEEDQGAAGQQPGVSDAPGAASDGQEGAAGKKKSTAKAKVGCMIV